MRENHLDERGRWYCGELARQARDMYADRSWEQIEATLENAWNAGRHGMPWSEARWWVKSEWGGYFALLDANPVLKAADARMQDSASEPLHSARQVE